MSNYEWHNLKTIPHQEDHDDGRVPDTLENGAKLPHHAHAAHPQVLSDRDFEEEERDATCEPGQEVGNQEGT